MGRKSQKLSSSAHPSVPAKLSRCFIHPVNTRAWPSFRTFPEICRHFRHFACKSHW